MKKIYLSLFSILVAQLMIAQSFTKATNLLSTGYNSGGCTGVTDMNNDGLDDIIILDQSTDLKIAYQQMNGSFVVSSFGTVSNSSQWGMCIGDVDNDGHKDVLSGGNYDDVHVVNINGPGDYEQIDYAWASIFLQGSNLADINNDGWLDGFLCHDDGESAILENNGDGLFSNGASLIDLDFSTTDDSGNYGSVWSDVDGDGDTDCLIAKCRQFINDPYDARRTNRLLINDGNNNYTEEADARGLVNLQQSWTGDLADVDNDGDFDVLLTTHSNTLELYENDGNGYFTDVTAGTGLEVSGFFLQAKMVDFDNDGFVDLVHSGGTHRYFHNNGDMTFTQIDNTFPNVDVMHSFGIGDLNHDGYLDLFASYGDGYVDADMSNDDQIFMNDGGSNNFIVFDLEGTISNTDAAGAVVKLYGPWGIQTREVRNGESYGISNASAINFGIGEATSIDQAVIQWPSGLTTTIDNPTINTWYNVLEGECYLAAPNVSAQGSTEFCEGGSVTLNVANSNLDYVWNNGETSSSISVSDPGNYFVTVSDDNGCSAISQAISVSYAQNDVPTVTINGDLAFCEGSSVELLSSNGSSYTWSNGQITQAISVTASGTYTVQVMGQCALATSESIEVLVYDAPSTPSISDIDITQGTSATFSVTGGNDIRWYDSASATVPVFEGNDFTTPLLNATTSYWVEDVMVYGGETGTGGKTENTVNNSGQYQQSTAYYNLFDVISDVYIRTVKVYASGAGDRTIDVIDNFGNMITSGTFAIPDGESVVQLDFFVPAGTGYGIRCTSNNPQLWRDKDTSVDMPFGFPYDIDGLVTITNTNVATAGDDDNYYYFFYEWNVETPSWECASAREEVQAIVIGVNELSGVLDMTIYPNPATTDLNVSMNSLAGGKMNMNLLDNTGRVIQTAQWNTNSGLNNYKIDVANVAAGVYQMQFTLNGNSVSRKVIID